MTTKIIRIELLIEGVTTGIGNFTGDLHDAVCVFVVTNGFSSTIKKVSTGIIKIEDTKLSHHEKNFK